MSIVNAAINSIVSLFASPNSEAGNHAELSAEFCRFPHDFFARPKDYFTARDQEAWQSFQDKMARKIIPGILRGFEGSPVSDSGLKGASWKGKDFSLPRTAEQMERVCEKAGADGKISPEELKKISRKPEQTRRWVEFANSLHRNWQDLKISPEQLISESKAYVICEQLVDAEVAFDEEPEAVKNSAHKAHYCSQELSGYITRLRGMGLRTPDAGLIRATLSAAKAFGYGVEVDLYGGRPIEVEKYNSISAHYTWKFVEIDFAWAAGGLNNTELSLQLALIPIKNYESFFARDYQAKHPGMAPYAPEVPGKTIEDSISLLPVDRGIPMLHRYNEFIVEMVEANLDDEERQDFQTLQKEIWGAPLAEMGVIAQKRFTGQLAFVQTWGTALVTSASREALARQIFETSLFASSSLKLDQLGHLTPDAVSTVQRIAYFRELGIWEEFKIRRQFPSDVWNDSIEAINEDQIRFHQLMIRGMRNYHERQGDLP